MFMTSELATQLAREHYRRMLGDASQRQLAHQHARPANGTPDHAGLTRRLIAAIARAGRVAAQAPDAIWPAGPHPADEQAAQARTPSR
jgi:hypothetical protein